MFAARGGQAVRVAGVPKVGRRERFLPGARGREAVRHSRVRHECETSGAVSEARGRDAVRGPGVRAGRQGTELVLGTRRREAVFRTWVRETGPRQGVLPETRRARRRGAAAVRAAVLRQESREQDERAVRGARGGTPVFSIGVPENRAHADGHVPHARQRHPSARVNVPCFVPFEKSV